MSTGTRSIFIAGIISAVIIGGAAFASPAKALTIDEIQAQIRELVAKIAGLQEQLRAAQASPSQTPVSDITVTALPRICKFLPSYGIAFGARGEEVSSIQEFLRAEGVFSANVTGYFGPATRDALAKWQLQQGLEGVGVVGPMTRESIRARCGYWNALSVSPTSGAAPLSVNFTYRPSEENGQYYIEYGDGTGEQMTTRQIYCIKAPCISPATATHVYVRAGTYTATVNRYIACLYSNPRCMIAQPAPLATTQITVTGAGANGAPSISSFSGPTTLSVGESGTWTIRASDPENQALSYSITWGDEFSSPNTSSGAAPAREVFTQTTTFTHAYSRAGTYTVSILVRDVAGLEARTSSTVLVGSNQTVCTMEYAPVCGRPTGCANTCAPGMYCTLMCRLHDPVTYGNRCMMNAAGAEFLYEGQCSAPNSQ